MNSNDGQFGRVTQCSYDASGRLAGGAGKPAPVVTHEFEHAVDRSVRFRGTPRGMEWLACRETEVRTRVVLDDGSAATWVFTDERARPEGSSGANETLVLLSNLGGRLRMSGLRLRSIVTAGGETTRYEINESEGSVRVIGPDGRRTVYAPEPGYTLAAVVDQKTGLLKFEYEPAAERNDPSENSR